MFVNLTKSCIVNKPDVVGWETKDMKLTYIRGNYSDILTGLVKKRYFRS